MDDSFGSRILKKLDEFEQKIKNSFSMIRRDLEEASSKLDLMKSYMNEWDDKMESSITKDEEIKQQISNDMKEYSDKIAQIRLALAAIRSIKNEVVVTRDISKLEERARNSFKEEIDGYKKEIIDLRFAISNLTERIGQLERRKGSKVRQNSKKDSYKFYSNFEKI